MERLRKIFSHLKLSPRPLRWLLISGGAAAGAGIAGIFAVYLSVTSYTPQLPLGADLYALNRPQAFNFLDEQGKVVGRRGAIVGERLSLDQLPPYVPAAFLAMEDRHFYEHEGVDPSGILRAALVNLLEGQVAQGGSTITQQLAKILFLSPERTLSRKIAEMRYAMALEKSLSKRQILELYLNRIYLGSGAYGVDGAAHVYFGKSARKLTVAEAAMLAALTRAPTAFSPRRDLAAAQKRADKVLDAMFEMGAATDAQIAEARLRPAEITDLTEDNARNFFLDTAAEESRRLAGGAVGDLTVVVTLDTAMQSAARKAIENVLDKRGVKANATQAAFVAMTPEGAVKALIGGRDYAESTYNRITQAHRQPGSAFKPFVYLAALEAGLTPGMTREDRPITIGNWSPENYGHKEWGTLTLTEALAHSVNRVAVGIEQEVGVESVIAVARRLGITTTLQPDATLALGSSDVYPLELAAAFGSFASVGLQVRPYLVLEVRDAKGRVLYKRLKAAPERVMGEEQANAMNAMLYEVIESGTGRGAAVSGYELAGKTGTTQDYRDAWFVGYSTALVAAVWVGNDDFTPMKGVTGGGIPAQIWQRFMKAAVKKYPPGPLPREVPETLPEMAFVQTPYDEDALAEHEEEARSERRGFFDWLFGWGRDEDERPPPPRERRRERMREHPALGGSYYSPRDYERPPVREHAPADTMDAPVGPPQELGPPMDAPVEPPYAPDAYPDEPPPGYPQ
ncbi:MAG: transglycosylase domain-containing protein [Alphaproteobacteria bacterium]